MNFIVEIIKGQKFMFKNSIYLSKYGDNYETFKNLIYTISACQKNMNHLLF